ncbi:hypothetical protein HHK36_000726 [Tetracentron sinense]|uniref:Anaphase-promoting complex subunit 5 n=1 Tax=Tetracentron sinense TaxID=13715 RepID=A0A835DQZ2_TETSI|nr:hypothetical protein HHK36_000726 [Tetracentron sinense]
MAGILKPLGAFAITPHKVSVCILLQIYAPPAQISVPFPFSSVSQHNRLGLFLLASTKSCDDILEPKLDELVNQLKEIGGLLNHWLSDHLTRRLSSLSSPDDLFNFFSSLREILSTCPPYDLDELLECEDMDLEAFVIGKVSEEVEARKRARENYTFHIHAPRPLLGLVEGTTMALMIVYYYATNVAHSLFFMCYKFNLQVENATVLLLLAEIHKAECNVHSIVPPVESLPKTNLKSGNAVLGLPYALANLSYCQSFNLDLLEASVTLTLAELWLSLGSNHAKRASTLIHRALPMILGHGGLELRARAYIAEAKCYLSDPSFSVTGDPEVVLDPLRQASEELKVLEYHELAAEAFYLMAIVFDRLGQLEEREVAAAIFKKYVIALEHPEDEEDPILNGI